MSSANSRIASLFRVPFRALVCAVLAALTAGIATAAKRERFLAYRVERIVPASAPRIDGKLDEGVWRGKAAITSLRNFLGPLTGEAATQRSEIVIVTDGKTLYIGATFRDEDMASILFNPANAPFWNDCVEIYFDPRHDGTRSIQLVVDCGGGKFWQKRFDDGYGWWDDGSWRMLAKWDAAAARLADRWTVELALECSSFGVDASPGRVSGFNACRFRLGSKKQEFSAWSYGPAGRQKDMAAWGHLIFAAEGERAKGRAVSREDVALVYPDLGLRRAQSSRARTLEAPVEGGLVLYTRDSEKRVSFAGALAPLAREAEANLRRAAESLAGLPDGNRHAAGFRERLAELREEVAGLERGLELPGMTLGGYDKLLDRLTRAKEASFELVWKIKLTELVLGSVRRE